MLGPFKSQTLCSLKQRWLTCSLKAAFHFNDHFCSTIQSYGNELLIQTQQQLIMNSHLHFSQSAQLKEDEK